MARATSGQLAINNPASDITPSDWEASSSSDGSGTSTDASNQHIQDTRSPSARSDSKQIKKEEEAPLVQSGRQSSWLRAEEEEDLTTAVDDTKPAPQAAAHPSTLDTAEGDELTRAGDSTSFTSSSSSSAPTSSSSSTSAASTRCSRTKRRRSSGPSQRPASKKARHDFDAPDQAQDPTGEANLAETKLEPSSIRGRRGGLSRSPAYASLSEEEQDHSDAAASETISRALLSERGSAVVDMEKLIEATQSHAHLRALSAPASSSASPCGRLLSLPMNTADANPIVHRTRSTTAKARAASTDASNSPSSSSPSSSSASSKGTSASADHPVEPETRQASFSPSKNSRFLAKRKTSRTRKSSSSSKAAKTHTNPPPPIIHGHATRSAKGDSAVEGQTSPDQTGSEPSSSSSPSPHHNNTLSANLPCTQPTSSSNKNMEEADAAPVARRTRTRTAGRKKLPVRFDTPEPEDLPSSQRFVYWRGCGRGRKRAAPSSPPPPAPAPAPKDQEQSDAEPPPPVAELEEPPNGVARLYTAANEHAIAMIAYDRQYRYEPRRFAQRFDSDPWRSLEALSEVVKWHQREWVKTGKTQVTLYTSDPKVVVALDGKGKDRALVRAVEKLAVRLHRLETQGVEVSVDNLMRDKNRRAHDLADGTMKLNV